MQAHCVHRQLDVASARCRHWHHAQQTWQGRHPISPPIEISVHYIGISVPRCCTNTSPTTTTKNNSPGLFHHHIYKLTSHDITYHATGFTHNIITKTYEIVFCNTKYALMIEWCVGFIESFIGI